MGLCASAPEGNPVEKATSKQLESKLQKDHIQDKQINKLLLLGAGESGKSTLFKQMITIYGKGLSDEEVRSYISVVHNNIINSMKTLLKNAPKYSPIASSSASAAAKLDELKGDEPLTDDVAQAVVTLWGDKGIKQTYAERSNFQLTDSCSYFFEKARECAASNYVPTQQDILRSRVRTTGIVENEFVIDQSHFKLFDVGGQRNERKKWIHCFEGVTAVLFVAAISEYDQVLYEDETMNRVQEALTLFEEIATSRWFTNTAMILFLNKRDLFAEKIQRVPLTKGFCQYTGDNTYEATTKYIQNEFERRAKKTGQDKEIYTHITCATDRDQTKLVFDTVTHIIINLSIKESGLG